MRIYNTYTKTKEEFIPVKSQELGMYGCGVTPYKPSHLGHAMQAVTFDVIRRYFEYKGYKVIYVRNYTDIDDKIVDAAKNLGVNPLEHSKNIMAQCELDFRALRVRTADFEPKVSEHIPEILELIKLLLDKGYAYVTDTGNIYYSVRKFPDYGKLSNQNLDEVRHGTRKEVELDKKDPLDFALWKASENGETYWDSPWGNGRPGWHIECSAMSTKYLGKHFDIHGGGGDLLFPHHENEIAQSIAANGVFANYWIHNGLLMVGNDKMSKSINNDIAIKDWLKLYHSEVIRYLILTNHYRSHVQFNAKRYIEAGKKVYETYKSLRNVQPYDEEAIDQGQFKDLVAEFESYMDNDFNTVPVIAMIHRVLADKDMSLATNMEFIKTAGNVIGLFDLEPQSVLAEMEQLELAKAGVTADFINQQIKERLKLRASGKFQETDNLRSQLADKGISLLDGGTNTTWEPSFLV
jgi:cysteinyl-tRNA synthetase